MRNIITTTCKEQTVKVRLNRSICMTVVELALKFENISKLLLLLERTQ